MKHPNISESCADFASCEAPTRSPASRLALASCPSAGRDDRVIVGGFDEDIDDARRRDKLIAAKSARLVRKLSRIIPGLHLTPQFAWAGTFAQSRDGLPFIGTTADFPGWHFALGYGGNGFTFSLLAAQILCDAIRGKHNHDARLFRFDR
jgi:glycine/D-amino acid oxidase-like deaminating enzyme